MQHSLTTHPFPEAITLVDCVRRFRGLRALVIGDAMLDTYLVGEADRLCTEGPVPVVHKTAEYRLPGGAANTAVNLRALDAEVFLLGITGQDAAGAILRAVLHEQGVSDHWLLEDQTTTTLHKLRIMADRQYVVRFDEGGEIEHSQHADSTRRLLVTLEGLYQLCNLVVISDYRYGVISDMLIKRLKALHAASPKVWLIDSKALHRFRDIPATVITPNYREAQLLVHGEDYDQPTNESALSQTGRALRSMFAAEHIAITLGKQGIFLLDQQGHELHLPAHTVEHADDVGAGDSFASAMALALASGGRSEQAAQIGIEAASIAVSRRWTATVHHQELLQRVSLKDYIALSGQGDKHDITKRLAALLETRRLDGLIIVFTNGIFDILHAGHIQFLRQARALGDVLVVGVNSDSSVRRLKGPGRPIIGEQDRMALVAALDMVDHVVLFDEETPAELIRTLHPHLHVKGGDYSTMDLPEAEAVREVGGKVVILPLASYDAGVDASWNEQALLMQRIREETTR